MVDGTYIVDNHIHVGWFTDGYHSPNEIWKAVNECGIDEIAVSSTSTCAELYKKVVREMRELHLMGGDKVLPILWLTPKMFIGREYGIKYLLRSKVEWRGIKFHWWAHRQWYYDRRLLNKAINIAKSLQVPIMFHTGETKETYPLNFLQLCRENNDIQFILAHGRPPAQTMDILRSCQNTMVDTSFMPFDWKRQFIDAGFATRLAFGTDVPINKIYFTDETTSAFVRRHLSEIRQITDNITFKQIVSRNLYK